MRVVFWGTPEFALPSLRRLMESDHRVTGVITQPDRPAGRGRKLRAPPVKVEAKRHDLPVLQPDRPRGPDFMQALGDLAPEISAVAAYGAILPREVLDLPRHGSVNVHASLLPKHRGAAPVNWAIIEGDDKTGVTIMRMVEELDAGPIIAQAEVTITADTTAGELSDTLARLGGELLVDVLDRIESEEATERPQVDADATYAPKLGSDEARLDWSLPAIELHRWIRGCDPVPAAWSQLDDVRVRLFVPRVLEQQASEEPGTVVQADPREGLAVETGSTWLGIDEVQPAGKRRMQTVEWIRGRGVSEGQRFH